MRWIALLTALVLAGCSAVPENSPQRGTQESISQKITKGKTTKADVKSMFGDAALRSGAIKWRAHLAQ